MAVPTAALPLSAAEERLRAMRERETSGDSSEVPMAVTVPTAAAAYAEVPGATNEVPTAAAVPTAALPVSAAQERLRAMRERVRARIASQLNPSI